MPSMRFVWEMAAGSVTATTSCTRTSATRTPRPTPSSGRWLTTCATCTASGPGDRVAIAMRNYPEWVFSYWAIVSLGAACVGMNAWWTTDEMKYGLADSKPEGADRRRRARRAGPAGARRTAADAPAPRDRRALRRRTARRAVALGRRGRPATAPAGLPDADDRSRRRRLHLLHLGHDRLPEGRPAHPSRLGAQPDAHRSS